MAFECLCQTADLLNAAVLARELSRKVTLNFSSSLGLSRFSCELVGFFLPLTLTLVFLLIKLHVLFVLDAQVSKDDRSDIESSSDEEIYSNGSKNASHTKTAKDGGHTGNLNGDAHDH